MPIKNIIRSQNFFSSLEEEDLERLASISFLHHYKKEYMLQYENEECNELFFLCEGMAKAYKIDKHNNEVVLHYIYADSMISEISDTDAEKLRSFSNIQLIEDSQVLSINYQKFKKYFLETHLLQKEFTGEIVKRSLQLQSLINREFIFDAVSKVSMMLHDDLQMFNKLKRHEISLMLHIQPATLSRVLKRLKRNNIIDIIHGQVKIISQRALQNIYKDKIDD
ncbi:Crp/Fnr family transcriptional regulator [Sulfurimonas sp. SWIR-19]|uniref:Crp/Fnr family transcriptional regulator n=1 Tax=Sulfurimonas sp. SWIR-19 TaxID=2878390 RepID=UPI001CF1523C|nr:Crp/Fnr family transcriptional regulator [Sulfurimonas sp. SWIR-19]UCN00110.1 Crp/Fnr family transcriptional regulator [Sulfurimonas sp. SWIR-19]